MKFLRLTKFKPNPDLAEELVGNVTIGSSKSIDFKQCPIIMQLLNSNNIPNIVDVYVSTVFGPATHTIPPQDEYNTDGIHWIAPFRVYIPIGGTPCTLSDGVDSVEISEATVVAADKELTYSLPANSVSHMLTLIKGDGEFTGRLRFISNSEHKLTAFAKFCGLV